LFGDSGLCSQLVCENIEFVISMTTHPVDAEFLGKMGGDGYRFSKYLFCALEEG
jgi:hypothetical protein